LKVISVYPGSESIGDAFAATVTAGSDQPHCYGGFFILESCQPFRSQDLAKLIDNVSATHNPLATVMTREDTIFILGDSTDGPCYMGVGPPSMRVGDTVCLLYGGGALYVLRPKDDHYELVGDCYVHGLMKGELHQMKAAGVLKDEYFELR
jgi:hypothetical protein